MLLRYTQRAAAPCFDATPAPIRAIATRLRHADAFAAIITPLCRGMVLPCDYAMLYILLLIC